VFWRSVVAVCAYEANALKRSPSTPLTWASGARFHNAAGCAGARTGGREILQWLQEVSQPYGPKLPLQTTWALSAHSFLGCTEEATQRMPSL